MTFGRLIACGLIASGLLACNGTPNSHKPDGRASTIPAQTEKPDIGNNASQQPASNELAMPCYEDSSPPPLGRMVPGEIVIACRGSRGISIPILYTTSSPAAQIEDKIWLVGGWTLTDAERSRGWVLPWSKEKLRVVGVELHQGHATIDLAAEVTALVIVSTANSGAFTIPLVGTAFLDPTVSKVTIAIEGDTRRAADWWESANALEWTREQWNKIYDNR